MIALINCPIDFESLKMNDVYSKITRNLSHTEMAFVLPAIESGLKELVKFNCTICIPEKKLGLTRYCFGAFSEVDEKNVEMVLCKMAEQIHKGDPYGTTTLDAAREMLGLDPMSKTTILKKTKSLMTIRVSEEAFESLRAEARLTDRSVSQVVRSRIKLHVKKIFGQTTEQEELIRAELKTAMQRAVKMSDTELEKHTLWMRGHIERENAEHMLNELAIYEAELAHRQPLAPSTNIFDRLPPFKQ